MLASVSKIATNPTSTTPSTPAMISETRASAAPSPLQGGGPDEAIRFDPECCNGKSPLAWRTIQPERAGHTRQAR